MRSATRILPLVALLVAAQLVCAELSGQERWVEEAEVQPSSGGGGGRQLLQVGGCTLTVGGEQHSFDACSDVATSNSPYKLFYTLTADADGKGVLRAGISASGVGWAGVGFGSSLMPNTPTAIVKTDTGASSGASVNGYILPGDYSASSVNAAAGSWALTDASASLADGNLAAVFTGTLPQSANEIAGQPYLFIWATGAMGPSGNLRQHQQFDSSNLQLTVSTGAASAGGSTTGAAADAPAPAPAPAAAVASSPPPKTVVTVTPPATAAPLPSPPPPSPPAAAPAKAPAPAPEAAPEATPVGTAVGTVQGAAQSCSLALANGASQVFPSCAPITGTPITLYWSALPAGSARRRLSQAQTQVLVGFSGATDGQGWIAVGLPSEAGRMVGASAFILQDCAACPSGARITEYYLASDRQSGVQPANRTGATGLAAARGPGGTLSGTVVISLDTSATDTPLIFAVGPLSNSGTPLQHDVYASASVPLQQQGGSVSGVSTGSGAQTQKDAHAWLMAISWGVLIPAGIVMARCFKELDPFWFKFHRIVQSLAFLTAIAGFLLGFSIRGWQWETPYPVHRNLGLACMVLGLAQMTALVYRPLKSAPLRRYWNWNHLWVGRAAAACAIGNIYYGIVNVEKLGTWAWAAYTAVLGCIVAVAVVKDGMDFYSGRRTPCSECAGRGSGGGASAAASRRGVPPPDHSSSGGSIKEEGTQFLASSSTPDGVVHRV